MFENLKCITYGWVIVLLIVLSVLVSLIGFNNPKLASTVYLLGFVGLHVWWLYGWFSECPDGYYGNLMKMPTSNE